MAVLCRAATLLSEQIDSRFLPTKEATKGRHAVTSGDLTGSLLKFSKINGLCIPRKFDLKDCKPVAGRRGSNRSQPEILPVQY